MSVSTTTSSVNSTPKSYGVVEKVIPVGYSRVRSSLGIDIDIGISMKSNMDQTIIDTLDGLMNQCQDWEQNELAKSNERLYSILTECYALFQSINGTDKQKIMAKRSFDRVAKQKGFEFVDSKHYTTRVVSIVFNDQKQSRRIARYANALRIATDQNVPVNELKDFFYLNGGIDEIQKKVRAGSTTIDRHIKGRAILYKPAITTITDSKLAQEIPASNYGLPVILMANYNENSQEFEIVGVTQNPSATKMAFSSFASVITEDSREYAMLKAEFEEDEFEDDAKTL